MVSDLPFPEGVRFVRGSQDERNDHFGRYTAQCRACRFTVDVRVTDRYTNEEVLDIIRQHVACDVQPRSTRLRPSSISPDHPIVRAGIALGRTTYGSPTTSDQALLDIPSLKLGGGDSARSHSADEFVHLSEIREGIDLYIKMLAAVLE